MNNTEYLTHVHENGDQMISRATAKALIDTGSYLNNFDKPNSEWTKMPNGTVIPCYCNCRYLLAHPVEATTIGSFLTEGFNKNFPEAEVVIALATAGMYWGTQIAVGNRLPFGYVRSEQKGYGVGKLVEGNPSRNTKAVIVDDALNSGASVIKAINALKEERNIEVIGFTGIVALSGWGFDNHWDNFPGLNIKTLTDYKEIIRYLESQQRVNSFQANILRNVYESPNSFNYEKNIDSNY